MTRSRVSVTQPEYNYILHGMGAARNDPYRWIDPVRVNVSVDRPLGAALRRHPAFALAACWKHTMGRSGLSPFVMHYLLEEKRSIEDFIAYIKKQHNKLWSYHYCGTTLLPVVSCFAAINWDNFSSYKLINVSPRRYIVDPWEQNHIARQKVKRENAELDGLVYYKQALSQANVDEAMRTFRGSSIKKESWMHLKGVAGIYK